MSPRVPGTRKRSQWELVPNPGFEGREPTPLKALCHDGTPYITIVCDCGEVMHQHESSVRHVPDHAEVASRCKTCHRTLVFPPGYFKQVFKRLRDEGWIDE